MTSTMLTYRGHAIAEKAEALSLTDMWKAHGSDLARQPSNWLASAEAKNFIEVLNPGNSGIMTKRGKNGGTFAHWQIAMAYAKYLSPEFHMWCNDVVRAHMEARNALPGGTSLVHVEQTLARLEAATETQIGGLHGHLKNGLGSRLTNMAEYLHQRLWNQYTREVRIIRVLEYLVSRVDALTAPKPAEEGNVFVADEWADLDRVLRMAGHPFQMPQPRVLNARLVKSLDDFCVETGRWGDSSRDPFGRRCRIWRKSAVQAWVKDRGKALIDQHIAQFRHDNVLKFAKADAEGK